MTVCVAAICRFFVPQPDGSNLEQPMVIFASDRMITVGKMREYEMATQTKMFVMTPLMSVLISGSGELLLEVCQRTWKDVQGNGMNSVRQVAELLKQHFKEYRNERIEAVVLAPRNLSWDGYYQRQSTLAQSFRAQIEEEIDSFDRDLGTLLLVGVDEDGPHIYAVEDPGVVQPRGQSGYAAIGIGAEFAQAEFMAHGYTPSFPWELSLWLTYSAKKRAEVAAGVGEQTDLYWIIPTGRAQFGPGTELERRLSEQFQKRAQAEKIATYADTQEIMRIWGELNATPEQQQEKSPTAEQEPIRGSLEEGKPPSDIEGEAGESAR